MTCNTKMTDIRLQQYFQQVENTLNSRDGVAAARWFSFTDCHVSERSLQVEKPESACEQWFTRPWDEMVAAHLRCCWAVASRDFIEAYRCQNVVVQTFTRILQSQKDENWGLAILFSVTLHLRLFAISSDRQLGSRDRSKSTDSLEKAAECLMGCFRVCASDSRAAPADSKKWGMLNLVNQLFKIYFKINKLHLCKPLIRAVDSLPFKERFSMSQRVTYKYYVGRKAMFDSDFKSAEEYLTFAFQHCHRDSKRNKTLIMIYLLPVKMLLGHMPSMQILRKYELPQFVELTKAVSAGNLLEMKSALAKNEDFFIACGIYLILEKLKIITYRNLFKKIALILKTHQIPINAFTVGLQMMGEEDVDDDEVECIVANLIYENKIKGYISHQHRKLVVSKQNAFPPLSGST